MSTTQLNMNVSFKKIQMHQADKIAMTTVLTTDFFL